MPSPASDAPEPRIRAATIEDARGIATIHVTSQQSAYAGILPAGALDGLSVDARAEHWRAHLERWPDGLRLWVIEGEGPAVGVLGFCGTEPGEPDEPPGIGWLHWIHVLPAHVGTGLGRWLFAHAVEDLAAQGYAGAALWVLEGNARARRFYEAAGWRADGASRAYRLPFTSAAPGPREVRYRVTL